MRMMRKTVGMLLLCSCVGVGMGRVYGAMAEEGGVPDPYDEFQKLLRGLYVNMPAIQEWVTKYKDTPTADDERITVPEYELQAFSNRGATNVVKALLDAGVNPLKKDKDNRNALNYANEGGDYGQVFKLLLDKVPKGAMIIVNGEKIRVIDDMLPRAVQKENVYIASLLLARGADSVFAHPAPIFKGDTASRIAFKKGLKQLHLLTKMIIQNTYNNSVGIAKSSRDFREYIDAWLNAIAQDPEIIRFVHGLFTVNSKVVNDDPQGIYATLDAFVNPQQLSSVSGDGEGDSTEAPPLDRQPSVTLFQQFKRLADEVSQGNKKPEMAGIEAREQLKKIMNTAKDEQDKECSVCYERFDKGDASGEQMPIVVLPCGHHLHHKCFVITSNQLCPTCRGATQKIAFEFTIPVSEAEEAEDEVKRPEAPQQYWECGDSRGGVPCWAGTIYPSEGRCPRCNRKALRGPFPGPMPAQN